MHSISSSVSLGVSVTNVQKDTDAPSSFFLLFLEVQGHLAKGQRMLAGDGMSQVTKNLLDLTQRRNFYAGDLLSSVEILRNVTETFKRASYEPSSDDVQVSRVFFISTRRAGILLKNIHISLRATRLTNTSRTNKR